MNMLNGMVAQDMAAERDRNLDRAAELDRRARNRPQSDIVLSRSRRRRLGLAALRRWVVHPVPQ
ncbi:hypothetical protein [Ornithinimicrobium sediminis]|uniref:hypothetical protein n=1 Tax=Ornithinimicrobium sediminis TaxID=2904603 RepID=UPI001E2BC0B1|nr:hypothetical protein [Ornithinimicrobium sediminis]MCE0485356.1 hypothetical protein [Ornithinimicrobium sediminis]